ncbi:MAG: hypothetical protein Q8P35_00055 [Candidatus Yanofskybacteria bacterium]|nr:hypothetical protein [Candidatus Yanofskybacteria bacterium]
MDVSSLQALIPANLSADLSAITGPQQLFAMLGALFFFLYGMSVGKTRALISLLAIYVAFELTNIFPYLNQLIAVIPWRIEPYMVQIIMFLVVYLVIFVLLNKSSLHGRLTSHEMAFWQVLIISVLQIGLLGATTTSFAPAEITKALLGPFYAFFASPTALFFWAVGSLAVLPFFRGSRRRKGISVPTSK